MSGVYCGRCDRVFGRIVMAIELWTVKATECSELSGLSCWSLEETVESEVLEGSQDSSGAVYVMS